MQKKLLRHLVSNHPVEPHHLANLGSIIDATEQQAAEASAEMARSLKSIKKILATATSRLPDHKPAAKKFYATLKEQAIRELNEITDTALFLRALKAEHDPNARGGPLFTNRKDLRAYLDRLVS